MRIVLDTSVVINHKRRSEGRLKNPDFYGPQLDYVDARRGDLLLPERDGIWPETREYAAASLRPFERVYGYERHEAALAGLKGRLIDDPLCDESVRWIARKLRRGAPGDLGGEERARIDAVLGRIGMPGGEAAMGVGRMAREAVAAHGRREGGAGDLEYLLRRLASAASRDMQVLAIAMRESERRPSILLTTDYDLLAFPAWRGRLAGAECGPATMVMGPSDAMWIVSMPDGSARAVVDRRAARGLYSGEDYAEVARALQHSMHGR